MSPKAKPSKSEEEEPVEAGQLLHTFLAHLAEEAMLAGCEEPGVYLSEESSNEIIQGFIQKLRDRKGS